MNPNSNQPPIIHSAPAPKKSSKKRRSILKKIAIVAGALLVLGAGAWAAWEFLIPRVALTTFEDEGYSVAVPADYEKRPSNGSYLFEEPGEPGDYTLSSVSTSTSSYQAQGIDQETAIKQHEQLYSEETYSKLLQDAAGIEIRNFTTKSQTFEGFESRYVSFDSYKDGEKTRSSSIRAVFSEEAMYTVSVNVHPDDSKLSWTVRRILDSVKITQS